MLLALLADEERLDVGAGASAAQATGSAPIVMPPTAVAPSSRACSATSSPSARKPAGSRIAALRVDVVLRGGAARERDLADHERVLAQLGDQARA